MFSYALIPATLKELTHVMLYDYMIPYEPKISGCHLYVHETTFNALAICERDLTWRCGNPSVKVEQYSAFSERHILPIKNTPAWLVDLRYLPLMRDIPEHFETTRVIIASQPFTVELKNQLAQQFPWLKWWGNCGNSVSFYTQTGERTCDHNRYVSSSDSDEDDIFHSAGMIIDFDVRQPFMRMWLECRLHKAILELKKWNKNKDATRIPFPPYPDAVSGVDAICRQYNTGNKEILLNEIESLQLSVDVKTAETQIFRRLLKIADSLSKSRLL